MLNRWKNLSNNRWTEVRKSTCSPRTYEKYHKIRKPGEEMQRDKRTLGCEMRQSTTEESARATGRASPAYPPIEAPTPVGTIITLV